MSRRASKKSSRKTGFFKWLRDQFGLSARPVLDARRLWFQDLETRRLLVAPIATYSDGVSAPFALAFDTSGNLYVANEGNNPGTVEKFAPGSTTPSAIYNTGVGSGPGALAFDSSQNLYVGDEGGNVLEFAPNTTTPSATYPGSLGFNEPFALAIDSSNNLYVANYGGGGGNTVFKFASGSTALSAIYSGLEGPAFLVLDSSNNLYVANGSGTTVEKFAAGSTSLVATYADGVNNPYGLAFDSSHNLYVANFGNNTVEKFAQGSTTPSAIYNTGVGSGPDAVVVDSAGNVYVSNLDNNSVVEFAAGSTTPSVAYTSGISGPEYLALDSSGNLFVANGTGTTVEEFASAIKASKLQVSASPSSLSAGSTTSVTITAEDSSSNVVTGFSDSVTLSDSLGGASFSAISFTNGVATVTATLDKASTQTITATDTAGDTTVTAGTSSPITVTPAAASKLLVSASPSSLSAGQTTSVSITAEDQFNNIVTGFSDSVMLSDGLGGATFSANPVTSFTSGKATVTATLDKAGTQTVTAHDSSATIVGTSNSISVAPGAATQLLITSQPPSTVTAGMGFRFTVTAEDAEDNVATGFNGSETVALHDSPFGGTLSGTLTSSAAGGIATFSGLTLNEASTDYRLVVTSGTLTSAPSSWITVVPGTATQLLITSQPPSTVTADSEFNFTVTAEDADGNADPNFDGSETVALAGGPMGGTLSGTPTVSATAGVATFSGLILNTVGDYTLDVTSGTLTLATSNLISVTPVPASGSEFQVNTYTPGNQQIAKVAMDAAGDYVIAWQGYYYNVGYGAGYNIYAQRYNANGAELGSQFQVNTYTGRDSTTPSVAMDSAGDFVVAWVGYDGAAGEYGVYAQQYTASGATNGSNFLVNTYTALSNQLAPSVAMDSAGDFVVAWNTVNEDGSNYGVYAQRYNASGMTNGSEFRVNTYTPGDQSAPSAAMDSAGDFVIAWTSYGEDGSGNGVYAQLYNVSGATNGSEFQVNTYTTDNQSASSVAMDSAGDFVVAWQSGSFSSPTTEDGSNYGVYAQRYNASGATEGSEFQVNTYTTGLQNAPSVAMDSAGDFVVVWQSPEDGGPNPADAGQFGVYGQAYNANGQAQASEFQVNTYTPGLQGGPAVARDSAGDFVVAWQSQYQDGSLFGIYAKRYEVPSSEASKLVVSASPGTLTAGSTTSVTITAEDSSNQVVTSFSDSVTLSDSLGGASFGTVTFTSGVATVTATLDKAGTQTITATDTTTGTVSAATSSPITVTPGAATQLVISTEPPSTVAPGMMFGLTVTAEDAEGNATTGFSGDETVSLDSNPAGDSFTPVTVPSVNGVAKFNGLALNLDGDYTLQVVGGEIPPVVSNSITVTPGAPSQLLVSASPTGLTAGGTTSITITAEDQSNNVVSGFSDSVTLSDSLGGASFGAVTFASGVATVTATLDTAGTQTITATDTAGGSVVTPGTSGSITVSPSAPPSFDLTISTAATNNVSFSGGVFSATGGNPNINIGDLHTALVSNANVVVTNAGLTGDSDNIEWLAGANLNSSGIPSGHTLTIETAPTATAGNLSIASTVNLPGDLLLSGQSVSLNAAVNAGGTLWINSGGAVSQSAALSAANLSIAASGNVTLTATSNSVGGELAIHDAALGAYVEWLDSDGFQVGSIAAATAAEDPQSVFGAVAGVSASGNFIALENTSGNMLLGDGGPGEGVTATGNGGDVRLDSAGQITQNATGGGAITAGALGIVAAGNIDLSQSPNTAMLVSINDSTGYVRFVDSEGFIVGSVGAGGTVFPNTVHGVTTVGGDIGLQTNSGNLILGNGNSSEVVSATGTGGDVRLDSAGSILQTPGSGAITAAAFAVVANGNVDLSESANTVFLVAISDSSGYVRLVDSESFIVGTVGGVSAKLDPNTNHGVSTVGADIGLETTNGSMILGNGNADEVISATGVGGDVRLDSAGYIMQNTSAGGAITAGALGIVAHGNVDLSESPNRVLVLSIHNSSGYAHFVNNQSLAVGSVGPAGTIFASAIHGVTTVDGDIGLQTNSGSLQLGNGNSSEIVSATGAGGDVRLESAGSLYQDASGGGAITAAAFGVVAAGPITLNVASNNVTVILAIDDTAAGAVNFSDSAAFAQGTVGAVSAKIFPHAITGVTTVSNNVHL